MISSDAAQWNDRHDHVLGRGGLRGSSGGDRCPRCGVEMIMCRGRCLPTAAEIEKVFEKQEVNHGEEN